MLVGAFLVFAPLGARAASALYAAATPVPNQSAAARTQAFARDLAAVFVKVSGNPQATQVAGLAAALEQADKLVLEYRYRRAPAASGGGLELWARFDEKTVNSTLAAAGQAIWGKNRPSVVAWLLTPSGIVGDDPANPVAGAMLETADERGLPLVLPLMDLTDRKQVSAFAVRSFFLPALKTASKRYGTKAMLVGSITPSGQGFASQWQLVLGATTMPFAATAASPQAAASAGVGQAATLLAQEFAYLPNPGGGGELLLSVTGISDLGAETAVRRIVEAVQGVNGLQLVRVEDARATWRLSYDGAPDDFARRLALAGSLSRLAAPPPASVAIGAPAVATSLPRLDFRYTP